MRRSRQTRVASAPLGLRSAKIRFSKRMRTVQKIYEELEEILGSLPHPPKEKIEEAVKSIHGITPDLHFMGVLHEVVFLLSEACLVAEEQERFVTSRARRFLVDSLVIRGLVNLGGADIRVPTIEMITDLPCPLSVDRKRRAQSSAEPDLIPYRRP